MEADWYYLTSIDLKCDTFQILAVISLTKSFLSQLILSCIQNSILSKINHSSFKKDLEIG